MRVFGFCLCSLLLPACAAQRMTPVASAEPSVATRRSPPSPGTEVRHMYLFAPGKAPVKIVMLDDGTTTEDRSWALPSSE